MLKKLRTWVGGRRPGGPPSLDIPGGVFTSQDARDFNHRAVLAALEKELVEPSSVSIDHLTTRIFVEADARQHLASILKSLLKQNFEVDIFFRHGKVSLCSSDVLDADRHAKVTAFAAYRRFAIGKRTFPLCRLYACEVILVKEENGWFEPLRKDAPPSYGKMTERIASLVYPGPIDVVYTWVDGCDPAWIEKKTLAAAHETEKLPSTLIRSDRYENPDELRYSIRSVVNYAPWVRNIYIVTDGQVPDWHIPNDRVRIVDHKAIFPDPSVLPNFNSHAIESALHRINGLSEIFLYFNDDVFINRPISIGQFVAPNGILNVFTSKNRIPIGPAEGRVLSSEWGSINISSVLRKIVDKPIIFKLKHVPHVLSRSLMYEFETICSEAFACVRRNRFRSPTDIAPIIGFQNWAIWRGRAVPHDIDTAYISLTAPDLPEKLSKLGSKCKSLTFCINEDELKPLLDRESVAHTIRDKLEQLYPAKAPFER